MPIYVWACRACPQRTEVLRSMADINDPMTCASCGSTETYRVPAGASLSQFYLEAEPISRPGPGAPVGIALGPGRDNVLADVTLSGFSVGVSVDRGEVAIHDSKLKGNRVGIQGRDADITLSGETEIS